MRSVLGAVVVYLGLIAVFCGVISLIKPPARLGIRTRRQAATLFTAGFVVVLVGWTLPAKEVRVDATRTHLDEFVPVYQFHEFHSIRINAPREKVYATIKSWLR